MVSAEVQAHSATSSRGSTMFRQNYVCPRTSGMTFKFCQPVLVSRLCPGLCSQQANSITLAG